MLLDPRHLIDSRRDVGGLAGELVDLGRAVPEDLVGGADVEPQDPVAQRGAVGGEGRERLALMRDAERLDAFLLGRGQFAHGLADRLAGGSPPLARVVLAEALLRREQRDFAPTQRNDVSLDIDDDCLGGRRRRVDGYDQGAIDACGCHVFSLNGWISPRRLSARRRGACVKIRKAAHWFRADSRRACPGSPTARCRSRGWPCSARSRR